MNLQILAIFIQEGSKLVSELIRQRPIKRPHSLPQLTSEFSSITSPMETKSSESPNKATSVESDIEQKLEKGTACLPCTNSHLHTCVGLLNEAVRMSHDGISKEGIKRIDSCLGEIAAAERIDLAPANVVDLSQEEKKIANYASKELREIRHSLEGISSPGELEQIAARTAKLQQHVGSEWFKYRLGEMNKGEKREFVRKVTEKAITKLEK